MLALGLISACVGLHGLLEQQQQGCRSQPLTSKHSKGTVMSIAPVIHSHACRHVKP